VNVELGHGGMARVRRVEGMAGERFGPGHSVGGGWTKLGGSNQGEGWSNFC